jgi:hypothetical protein
MVDSIVLWTAIGVLVTLALGIATLIRTEVLAKRQSTAERNREEAVFASFSGGQQTRTRESEEPSTRPTARAV